MNNLIIEHYDRAYYASGHAGNYADPRVYDLMSVYWREEIFTGQGLDAGRKVLDWGAGMGNRSAALPDTVCYDASPYARRALAARGRTVARSETALEPGGFDYILCAHVLEHVFSPGQELAKLRRWLRADGLLVLLLPMERDREPAGAAPDDDRHLFAWTFRTVTNLLRATGWRPVRQGLAFQPLGLKSLALGLGVPVAKAVEISRRLGRLKRSRASLFILAGKSQAAYEDIVA